MKLSFLPHSHSRPVVVFLLFNARSRRLGILAGKADLSRHREPRPWLGSPGLPAAGLSFLQPPDLHTVPFLGARSQSALPTSWLPQPVKNRHPPRIQNPVPRCDQSLDWGWARGLPYWTRGIAAWGRDHCCCAPTLRCHRVCTHRLWPSPRPKLMDKFSPGIKQALGLESENRQCLGCKGAGSIRNEWVGLGKGRSGGLGPVKATPWEAKSPSQRGGQTAGGGDACELKLQTCCILHCPKVLPIQNTNLKIKLLSISKQWTKNIKPKQEAFLRMGPCGPEPVPWSQAHV